MIIANCQANAATLSNGIEATGKFDMLSKVDGVPVVAFSLKDRACFDEYELSDQLRFTGWIVPAYTMAPDAQDVKLLRVVVREDFSLSLAERLLGDLLKAVDHLLARGPKSVDKVQSIAQKLLPNAGDDEKAHDGKAHAEEPHDGKKLHSHRKSDIFDSVLTAQRVAKAWKKSSHRGGNGVC